jgi:hypothetical protein
MQIESIWVSQRQLRNVAQVVLMQIALARGYHLPPVTIACCEDGSYQLEDGHHRLVAYWLSGQSMLESHQYFEVQKDRWKPRFGQIEELLDRVLHAISNKA